MLTWKRSVRPFCAMHGNESESETWSADEREEGLVGQWEEH